MATDGRDQAIDLGDAMNAPVIRNALLSAKVRLLARSLAG